VAVEVTEEPAEGPEAPAPSPPTPRFGVPGRPLRRNSPFFIGFAGGLGVLIAWHLSRTVFGLRDDLVLIAVSLFLAAGLNPAIEFFVRRGLARPWGVLIVVLAALGLFVGFVAAIVPALVHQSTALAHSLPTQLESLERNATVKRLDTRYHVVTRLQHAISASSVAATLGSGLLGFGRFLVSSVYKASIVLVLTLYFMGTLPSIKQSAYQLVPASRRERVRLLGDEVLNRIGGYVSGALVVSTCAGLTSWAMLAAIGASYALPLAMVIGATDLVPLVGATVGAVVVTGVVLIDSLAKAFVCAVFFIAYQQFENFLIYPRVMARTVKVPPIAAVFAALVGAAILGVVGALIAIPVASAGMLIIREVVMPRQEGA
jgi:predicted PurR-regulated permease PerM